MIKLSLPQSTSNLFTIASSSLAGPFSTQGLLSPEELSYRHATDYLQQRKGVFHENFVENQQINAEVNYLPYYADITPSPTSTFPDRIVFHGKSGSTNLDVSAERGLAITGNVGRMSYLGTYEYQAYEFSAGKLYIYWLSTNARDATTFSNCWKKEITYSQISGTSAHYNVAMYSQSSQSTSATRTGTFSFDSPSFDEIKRGVLANVSSVASIGTGSVSMYATRTSYSANIPSIQASIDALIVDTVFGKQFPIIDKDYGDLAMDASAKLNFTNVNVLELIKDLEHPWEMIPKLENLRNLRRLSGLRKAKRLANTYLSLHYGLLPTVDDLRHIWASFNKTAPNLDRNGFRTCSAGHAETQPDGNITYRLEQHIKIAVADEDSQLIDLINRAESIGIFPTLKNVWDLVPFSFVLDWFIDVGDFLRRVDTRLRLLRYDISYTTMSRKRIITGTLVPSSSSPYNGTVESALYTRWVSDQCPVPPLFPSNAPTVSNHWLEASALLIQRAR